jgi:hypothetical protein
MVAQSLPKRYNADADYEPCGTCSGRWILVTNRGDLNGGRGLDNLNPGGGDTAGGCEPSWNELSTRQHTLRPPGEPLLSKQDQLIGIDG